MNSRERRKLAALEHNDAIRYSAWLKANAVHYKPRSAGTTRLEERTTEYIRARRAGATRSEALLLASLMLQGYGI